MIMMGLRFGLVFAVLVVTVITIFVAVVATRGGDEARYGSRYGTVVHGDVVSLGHLEGL
jgi:hypothetical protein